MKRKEYEGIITIKAFESSDEPVVQFGVTVAKIQKKKNVCR